MAIAKVIQVISEGKTVDEAIANAVKEVAKTVEKIEQIDVDHIKGIVKDNKIVKIRLTAKISFIVDR